MKPQHVNELIAKLAVLGYEKEVPTHILKNALAEYVGIDKYRLRYTIETCIELGYFSWIGLNILKINGVKKL